MNVKLENKRFLAITELYAFIAIEADGSEGIMGFGNSPDNMIQMVVAGFDLVEKLKPVADQMIKFQPGLKYEIRHFKAAGAVKSGA